MADEEAYVLRLPLSLAARVRELMQAPGATRDMAMHIQFIDQPGFEKGRLARVRIGEDFFPATLMDLPTVVESAKSIDGVSFYKCGHVSQMLVVSEMMMTPAPPSNYVEADGLTPPARGIRKFWAANQPLNPRNATEAADIERVEAKLKRLVDGQELLEEEAPAPGVPAREAATSSGGGAGNVLVPRCVDEPSSFPTRHGQFPLPAHVERQAVAAQPSAPAASVPQHTFQDLFGDSDDDSDESDPAESGMDA